MGEQEVDLSAALWQLVLVGCRVRGQRSLEAGELVELALEGRRMYLD